MVSFELGKLNLVRVSGVIIVIIIIIILLLSLLLLSEL